MSFLIDLNYGENYKEEIDLKHKLENKIAKKLGLNKKQVLLNYGANSNLLLFFSAFSAETLFRKKRRLKVLLDTPNYFFTLHQIKEWHTNQIGIKRDSDFNLSIPKFIEAIKKSNPDIVVVTTPNNPTGKPVKDDDILKIIQSTKKETIALIDRSCLNTLPAISSKDILSKFKNKKLVIAHSFSKSHNMSDQRVGYLATNNEEISKFLYRKADLNHNLNALQNLEKVIDNNKLVNENKKRIRECNKILKKAFLKFRDATYYESFSNFAVIKLHPNIDSVFVEEYMKKKNILVMGGHRIGLGKEYIRLHMSSEEGINKFMGNYKKLI